MTRVPPALLLDRATLRGLMRVEDYFEAVREAFLAVGNGRAFAPAPLHLAVSDGGFHAKGAVLEGRRKVAAVKLNANFPANPEARGLPTIQGVLLLHDATDGRLLAVLDSAELTLRRTAAASAVAASLLARDDARTLAVCGCGAQALAQVEAIAAIRPVEQVRTWDADRAQAVRLARDVIAATGLSCDTPDGLAASVAEADIVVTCTTAGEPFLDADLVPAGAFVAAVGADSPSKNELTPGLLGGARVVVDSLEQCLAMGDLRHAVAAAAMTAEDIAGTLPELLAGTVPARRSEDEIWIFDSTGVAIQDVASALMAYERAVEAQVGVAFAFA